ncbi:hypothetical protein E2C01_029932 [Portunus trituberculatus]|uniref:Uncharacterized protein n=1 Tax=Portunus trituberculatus TaxID=210409 RepID=A0A5B7EUB2_PORTR|nr:hypothetical protein [Portunus trituberculatus]
MMAAPKSGVLGSSGRQLRPTHRKRWSSVLGRERAKTEAAPAESARVFVAPTQSPSSSLRHVQPSPLSDDPARSGARPGPCGT